MVRIYCLHNKMGNLDVYDDLDKWGWWARPINLDSRGKVQLLAVNFHLEKGKQDFLVG